MPTRIIVMEALLSEALAFENEAFEEDEPVDGGDMVQWFSEWRVRVKALMEE